MKSKAKSKGIVTISEVAAECGVAPSTVSNALTGRKFVRADTKALVVETAQRLGYTASVVARGLRMNRSWSIAFMVGDITNPFFPEVVRGAEDAILAAGYQLILINTDHNPDKQIEAVRYLQQRHIDGMILATQTRWREGDAVHFRPDIPVVMINQDYAGVTADVVRTDNEHGMLEACSHLWERGHRRIGFIRGLSGSPAADDRFECFVSAMQRLGVPSGSLMVEQGNHSVVSGDTATRRLLQRNPEITAIVSGNDLMAIGALDALKAMGISVPDGMSVVGNDDIFVSGFGGINLTTVRQPKRDLGFRAAEILLDRIEGKSSSRRITKVAPNLVVRGTTSVVRL